MHPLFDIEGKKAIVTGGSKGLGRGMAEGLMEAGVETVIIGFNDGVEKAAAEYCESGYRCYGINANLMNRDEVYRSFRRAMEYLGNDVDILINAAGIQKRHSAEEFPMEEWDQVIAINLSAVFIMCQEAGKIMLKKGSGKIINIASMASFFGGQTVPAYSAAKGGVAQLTKELTNDWAGRGVCINAIAPGYMVTDLNTALLQNKDRSDSISARIPMGRWGSGEDMKGTAIFLASKASDYLSGAIIPVDGGYLVK